MFSTKTLLAAVAAAVFAGHAHAFSTPSCWTSCFQQYNIESHGSLCSESAVNSCIVSSCYSSETAAAGYNAWLSTYCAESRHAGELRRRGASSVVSSIVSSPSSIVSSIVSRPSSIVSSIVSKPSSIVSKPSSAPASPSSIASATPTPTPAPSSSAPASPTSPAPSASYTGGAAAFPMGETGSIAVLLGLAAGLLV